MNVLTPPHFGILSRVIAVNIINLGMRVESHSYIVFQTFFNGGYVMN